MPLIVICGRPCVGKTRFAGQLVCHLRSLQLTVQLVNEETVCSQPMPRHQLFLPQNDALLRSQLKSAAHHWLANSDVYVVVDAWNDIKGFRYELYCLARTVRTAYCVVYVSCDLRQSDAWNRDSAEARQYPQTVLDDLRRRFEAPNPQNRWDNPLFKVKTAQGEGDKAPVPERREESATAQAEAKVPTKVKSSWKPMKKSLTSQQTNALAHEEQRSGGAKDGKVAGDEVAAAAPSSTGLMTLSFSGRQAELIAEDLSEFLTADEVVPVIADFCRTHNAQAQILPHCSTVAAQHGSADLLYESDRVSQEIVQAIVEHQQQGHVDTPLIWKPYDRSLLLHRVVSVAELQRLRRQFIKLHGQHAVDASSETLGASFIDFLALHV